MAFLYSFPKIKCVTRNPLSVSYLFQTKMAIIASITIIGAATPTAIVILDPEK